MPDVAFLDLLGVLVVAALAPVVAAVLPGIRVPAVVLEIVLGVVVGPHALGWLEPDLVVQIVALLGLALLLFLAGLEVDLRAWRGPLMGRVVLGYAASVGIGWLVGLLLHGAGWVGDPLLLGVTLSATSLGLVVAVLKDAQLLDSELGRTTITAASFADLAGIVLLSVLFTADGRGTGSRLVLMVLFAVLIGLVAVTAAVSARQARLSDLVVMLQDTTAEIRVRAAVLLLVAFVVQIGRAHV